MVIFITALCLIATPISSGFAKSWGCESMPRTGGHYETGRLLTHRVSRLSVALLASRLVLGLGMGVKGSTVPIFAAENSPASIRG